jgi:hypothetical protein
MARIAKPKAPTGFILYRGPSLLNGAPIVVVAITKKSSNVKTGNMVQTYILADNGMSPVLNAQLLNDASICGVCPHRRGLGGSCYVNLGQGPRAVADGVVRGIYPMGLPEAALASAGRMVRLGTYGDPAAVPAHVWNALVSFADGHTGYTHQWESGAAAHVMHLVMASADSAQHRATAKAAGYRTFRIRPAAAPVMQGEFVCPASEEAGKRKTCAQCGACSGGVDSRKADAVIIVHGSLASRFAVAQ